MKFKHTPQAVLDCVTALDSCQTGRSNLWAMKIVDDKRDQFMAFLLLSGCEVDPNGCVISSHVPGKDFWCMLTSGRTAFMRDIEGHFEGFTNNQEETING